MNFVRTAGEAWQAARRAPGALAAGIVRSGPGAGRDVREWETDMECASDPDGLAAGAGALPRARRTAPASGLLALLAATALLALAAPAQAQTEIWSATLTPQDLGEGALGCYSPELNPAVACSNTAVLSDNDFTLGSTDHTIVIIELGPGSLQITSTGVFTDADTLVLVLGTTSLAFSDGIPGSDGAGGDGRIWGSTGISWTAGTDVSVRLISLTTPGAPTGLAATANGPSQIDLAWTAPASTGGSAITGYTIEVSPDGSSWSDLVADTGSPDTAYAHMGLTPATTRHYRVSAINAVGTSDASDRETTPPPPPPTPLRRGAPTITGTAQVGQTLLALLAATALLALATPAQAQTEIWSATLTPQDLGEGALGCYSPELNPAVACDAVLSDNDFTLGSTDHTIVIIELGPGSLQITSTGRLHRRRHPRPRAGHHLSRFLRRHSRIRRRWRR